MNKTLRVNNIDFIVTPVRKLRWKLFYRERQWYVEMPLGQSEQAAIAFIKKNEKFIQKTLLRIVQTFQKDTTIYFLGQPYLIKYTYDAPYVEKELIYLNAELPEQSYYMLLNQYIEEFFLSRVKFYLDKFAVKLNVRRIDIKIVKSMLGSCKKSTGRILLNAKLSLFPLELIDYVIVHELAHMIVPNHSKAFYDEVAKILPDYKMRVKKIKEYEL